MTNWSTRRSTCSDCMARGILIRDNHGNWLYPDRDLDPAAGTDDISDYRPFNPHI